jgi:hypothetical protein
MHAIILLAATVLNAWPGTWSCTDTASNQKTAHYRMTASEFGTWMKLTTHPKAASGETYEVDTLVRYDSKAHHWVIISYSGRGGYILAMSRNGPNDATQTWQNVYPVDPSAEPGIIVMSKDRFTTSDAYKQNGVRVTAHTVCSKM